MNQGALARQKKKNKYQFRTRSFCFLSSPPQDFEYEIEKKYVLEKISLSVHCQKGKHNENAVK